MNHYNYQKTLQAVWQKAVDLYRSGNEDAKTYFNEQELDFLDLIGASAQEIFDFAEDFVDGGEPDFTTVAMIHDVRRAYLREQQQGNTSKAMLDPSTLPAKDSHIPLLPFINGILA